MMNSSWKCCATSLTHLTSQVMVMVMVMVMVTVMVMVMIITVVIRTTTMICFLAMMS